ncbi:hypothetical protein DENSPDRAFT_834311 [Dentipellis sp. KUC8613]|nr:hypothetical protein DENSPDRAFT_834311 [Dentipellis sp. KUC8613]
MSDNPMTHSHAHHTSPSRTSTRTFLQNSAGRSRQRTRPSTLTFGAAPPRTQVTSPAILLLPRLAVLRTPKQLHLPPLPPGRTRLILVPAPAEPPSPG